MMPDLLTITDLELWTRIGVTKAEREAEQRILMTVAMELDTKAAAKSDDVKKSINYSDVTADLKECAKKERKTIERFAENIAQMILRKYPAMKVMVNVKKFAVPESAHVSISINRLRQ